MKIVVDRGDEHLRGSVDLDRRGRNHFENGVHQRTKIVGERIRREPGAALPADGIDDRELELGRVHGEIEEEIVDQFNDLVDPGRLLVDLVDDHDRTEADFQGAGQHGPRLWHRSFGGIHQQQAAVGHVQHALDLAAEVGVAGGVDDVDLDAGVLDGGVLGEDGDAPLPLEVVGVHDQDTGGVGVAEDVGLLEEAVDEGGFAMVDVGDDGDIAQVATARNVYSDGHRRALSGEETAVRGGRRGGGGSQGTRPGPWKRGSNP